MSSRGNSRESEDANVKLVRNIHALELEIEKLRPENKKLRKNHQEEMRNRDRKEMFIVCMLSGCIVLYACVALVIRGSV